MSVHMIEDDKLIKSKHMYYKCMKYIMQRTHVFSGYELITIYTLYNIIIARNV